MELKHLVNARLSPQMRTWLWERKVAMGNRRIRELGKRLSQRIHEIAQQDLIELMRIRTKAEWELFRDTRRDALRRSLGIGREYRERGRAEPECAEPERAKIAERIVTNIIQNEHYQIDNLVFPGHKRIPITANLYRPVGVHGKTPAVLICHSHHHPKTEIELQCIGMTFAQQGCTVLIMDLLGHGERRQHPFAAHHDEWRTCRVDRQDYYFRYVLGMQMNMVGESLMGWMVQDIRRGIDLLCADPQVNQEHMILIGAVAGGGDIAAVAGALDDRVTAVVAFNFGGVPAGDWDSTRNLPDTARGGFWPWVILGSLAPRRLIYGKEFAWNSEQDLTWKCLRQIYALYDSRDSLRSVHGSGRVSGHGPLDSHCTNIGPIHRQQIYPIFQEWFGISIPARELSPPLDEEALYCLTPESRQTVRARSVHEVCREVCHEQLEASRVKRESQAANASSAYLQHQLQDILGPLAPCSTYRVRSKRHGIGRSEYVVLEVFEENISLRMQLLWPSGLSDTSPPVVVGLAQEGNLELRKKRRSLIQGLRACGIAVCLVEPRGIGDGRHGELYRGRISPSAGVAANSLMLGESLLSSRIRDLRTVIAYLRNHKALDGKRFALWGEALAPTNSSRPSLAVPLDASPYPEGSEPFGGVVALLAALYEPDVLAVYVHRGLLSYASVLDHPFAYLPADAIIRRILEVADLPDIAAALVPRPLRLERLVDGLNRPAGGRQVEAAYQRARAAYDRAGAAGCLLIESANESAETIAEWLLAHLRS